MATSPFSPSGARSEGHDAIAEASEAHDARMARFSERLRLGRAISVLQEAGAIRECEEHGPVQSPTRTRWSAPSTSPARIRRPVSLRTKPSPKSSEVLASIGDTCPECPPE